ncbi:hypothetical protein P4S93_17975 [Aneurinibacillus thermoaerophilus]|uniref:Uncharacterized protein n=1 Tax=Aneurinibacillus thermoaerophilus TaxID=143495 RepID=A0A1G8ESF2_ANETH|nr:hypothetical protein [Aneurinibacillus thermoaerophilus]MED0757422.1 hypothetical protein [Aneurinibacillus thermoaerophilus]MED0762608.1 hypothetical protein [Aneurinibacillus thermoaerophilus]SDH72832.1 hypothetical protein SAMN04489735_10482 [Aneurinibacillus thermoaerophilus]
MVDIIQPLLLDYVVQDMSARFDHALVNIAGELVQYPIHNTIISGRSVRKYVYVPETEAVGKQILGASLMDTAGNTLANNALNVIKNDKGFLIGFEFFVEVKANDI